MNLVPDRSQREYVNWTCQDGVATLVISNGPLNVISTGVNAEFAQCVDEMRDNPAVRVIVLTGAGNRAFVAGGDIKEMPRMLELGGKSFKEGHGDGFEKFAGLPQPTIAAINGLAYGGGLEVALLCDLRIVSEDVTFCLPEVKLGLFPAGGGTQRLARLVGKPKAKEMILLGEPISAQEALQIGLVNRIVPATQVLVAAQEIARRMAIKSGVVIRQIKKVIDEGYDMDLKAGLNLEASLFEEVFATADAREGITAFLEKRQPRFKHC